MTKKVLGDPIIIDSENFHFQGGEGWRLYLLYGTSSYERRKSYDNWDH